MSRRPALVTQADVARALRAAEKCRPPREVVIDRDGTIRIVLPTAAPPAPETPLDDDEPIDL